MRAVNLIPAEQRTGQPVGAGRSKGVAYAVLALVAGLAAMAYAYGSADHEVSSRQAQVASLTQQAQAVQQSAEKLAPYASFVSQREQRTQAVESLMDARFDWAHAFHELGRVLPSGVSISSLTGTIATASGTPGATSTSTSSAAATAGGAVTSATPPGTVPTFALAGCATNQPTVALTLQRLRLMDGVKEVTLGSSTASSSGGSSVTGCPSDGPVFNVQIMFDPLPSTSAVAAVAKPVSDTSSAAGGSSK
jgi:Tfp pilus assembly protein PilN